MQTLQLNIFEGRALRDQGIQRAQDKAEKDRNEKYFTKSKLVLQNVLFLY